ncbi:hypothetical protein Pcinc_035466 [Petrolisthes cinctipes]|uniref:Uncharacterized protein n=1 Tax=Petrolisthes cinctipes TaxID=88211 RepID=A0AAE1C0T5_PETCI|nr:hypothetical protein Pcinc_035466 [Petrolisthes cinctipes]
MPATSHSEAFVGVGSQVPGLIATGCHVTPIPAPISTQAGKPRGDRVREASLGSHSHTTQESEVAPGGTLVLGEVPGCVVVDLQGNVVVQEPTSATSTQYLVDQPIVVRLNHTNSHSNVSTAHTNSNTSHSESHVSHINSLAVSNTSHSDIHISHPNTHTTTHLSSHSSSHSNSHISSSHMSDYLGTDGDLSHTQHKEKEGYRDEGRETTSTAAAATTTRSKSTNKVKVEMDIDPKWIVRPVLTNTCEMDSGEGEDGGDRPRRSSAKKARQRWKTLHEDGGAVRVGARRTKRLNNPPRKKPTVRPECTEKEKVEPPPDLPEWAQGLGCVKVEEGQWVVGLADSKDILQETMEGHSRSLLCDYVRSHPSKLEHRHKLRDQQGRLMWQHRSVTFHGTPFTITASYLLKCTFSMNYKYKVKRKSNGDPTVRQQQTGEDTSGAREGERRCAGEGGEGETVTGGGREVARKKYKSVTYTSCPARIAIKDIVKYPGYAVSPNALSTERKSAMKALRLDIERGADVEKEVVFHVSLPLPSVHNHPLVGRSRHVHQSVAAKIRELVSEGVTTPKTIKDILDKHVESTHALDIVVPNLEDRAFYPKLKDIANLVYCHCRKMGITGKKRVGEMSNLDTAHRTRRRRKVIKEEEGNIGRCEAAGLNTLPLQASTLQEAVQTFCTDDTDRASLGGLEGRECVPEVDTTVRNPPQDSPNLSEVVRGQLDTLRGLTYCLQEVPSLQDLYHSLHALISQYVTPASSVNTNTTTTTTLPEGVTDNSATTAFIIQEPLVDSLATTSSQTGPNVSEHSTTTPAADHITISERDSSNPDASNKCRVPHGMVSTHNLRPLRTTPVALQCMVPTLAVSQLPPRTPTNTTTTTTSNTPHNLTHNLTHLVNPTSTPITTSPALSSSAPTYQTLGTLGQDGITQSGPAPVHLSIPPYFYYVQEVTVPEPGQSWTYSSTS